MKMAQEERNMEKRYPNSDTKIAGQNRPWSGPAFRALVREIEHHDVLGEGGSLNGLFIDLDNEKWAAPLRWQKEAMDILEMAALDFMTDTFAKAAFYCKVRGAITIDTRDLRIVEGTRQWAYGSPQYDQMMNDFIKKPRSDERHDNKTATRSAGIYNGKEFNRFLKGLDKPASINYETAPRGCQYCLFRCFYHVDDQDPGDARMNPSKLLLTLQIPMILIPSQSQHCGLLAGNS